MTVGIDVDGLAIAYAEAQRKTVHIDFAEFILQRSETREERFRRLIQADAIVTGAPSTDDLLAGAPTLSNDSCQPCISRLAGSSSQTAVIVHWASGNSKFTKEYLPKGLNRIEFWSTEDPSLAGQYSPTTDISALASHYVTHLDNAGITRPLLVGICSGGQLAFEIAQQLCERGSEVRGLLAINTQCPGVRQFPAGWATRDVYAYRLAFLSLTLASAGVEPTISRAARFLERLDWIDQGWSRQGFYWHQLIWTSALASTEAYKAQPIDLPIKVFHGGGPGAEHDRSSWSRLGSPVEVITVDQDSKSILASESFRLMVNELL